MKRFILGTIFCTFLLAPFIAWAQAKMTMKQIADNVYFMENPTGSSNATFVITNDGVLVFDFDIRTADQTLAAIRKLTDKKIKYIISSHSPETTQLARGIFARTGPPGSPRKIKSTTFKCRKQKSSRNARIPAIRDMQPIKRRSC